MAKVAFKSPVKARSKGLPPTENDSPTPGIRPSQLFISRKKNKVTKYGTYLYDLSLSSKLVSTKLRINSTPASTTCMSPPLGFMVICLAAKINTRHIIAEQTHP